MPNPEPNNSSFPLLILIGVNVGSLDTRWTRFFALACDWHGLPSVACAVHEALLEASTQKLRVIQLRQPGLLGPVNI
jgi:hypothetical protein